METPLPPAFQFLDFVGVERSTRRSGPGIHFDQHQVPKMHQQIRVEPFQILTVLNASSITAKTREISPAKVSFGKIEQYLTIHPPSSIHHVSVVNLTLPPQANTWSRRLSASRMLPPASRAMAQRLPEEMETDFDPAKRLPCAPKWLYRINSPQVMALAAGKNRYGYLVGSVVAKMNMTWRAALPGFSARR
jgi:hypothetical protein